MYLRKNIISLAQLLKSLALTNTKDRIYNPFTISSQTPLWYSEKNAALILCQDLHILRSPSQFLLDVLIGEQHIVKVLEFGCELGGTH